MSSCVTVQSTELIAHQLCANAKHTTHSLTRHAPFPLGRPGVCMHETPEYGVLWAAVFRVWLMTTGSHHSSAKCRGCPTLDVSIGPRPMPVWGQSGHNNLVINPTIGYHYFPPWHWLSSVPQTVIDYWPVTNYTVWRQRSECTESNLTYFIGESLCRGMYEWTNASSSHHQC